MRTKLRAKLQETHTQQKQVCYWTGLNKTQVSLWANGVRDIPMQHVITLCYKLECNPRDLVGWTE